MRKRFWALLLVSIMAIMLLPAITMATEDYKNKMTFSGDDDLKVSHYQSTEGIDHSALNQMDLIHDDVYYDRKEMPLAINKTVTTSIEEISIGGNCGKDGSNITWKFEDGTLTILGEGEMENYEIKFYPSLSSELSTAPWEEKGLIINHVIIQNGVTSIGDYAFFWCASLESIVIPESVTSIGHSAFGWCESLESIAIPESVTSIGPCAFFSCWYLKSIVIPKGVKTIEDNTFAGCESLESVVLPDGVTSIEDCALQGCPSLESIAIPESVAYIGQGAFLGCDALKSIVIPNNVKCISDETLFSCNSLESIVLPVSIKEIGKWAFKYCTNLKDVYYAGNQDQWDQILVSEENEPLKIANIHYNYIEQETIPPNTNKPQLDVNITTPTVFTDVPENAYFTDAVKWAVENGITMGTSSTTFSPYQTCTRAEIVTFLWRAAGSPENETTENLFTDVNQQSYYSDAILWAKLNAITNGTTSTTFSPDTGCTRAQVVNFLYNYAKRPTVNYTNNFKDVDSNAYYANAVRWALEQNITNGTSVDEFSPDEVCSRAQIVTFLYRYMAN